MRAHLARHRLSLGTYTDHIGELVTKLNVRQDDDYNLVVHRKLANALKYRLQQLHSKSRVIYNWEAPTGEKLTFWPPWTRAWAAEGWAGEDSPPAGWQRPPWWADTEEGEALRRQFWRGQQNGEQVRWWGEEEEEDVVSPPRLTADALRRLARQLPDGQGGQAAAPSRGRPSSEASSMRTIMPGESFSTTFPLLHQTRPPQPPPPIPSSTGPTTPTTFPLPHRTRRPQPPPSIPFSTGSMNLILEDLALLTRLKERAILVLVAAHRARGERRQWSARIQALHSALSRSSASLALQAEVHNALHVSQAECHALDNIGTQARAELDVHRVQADLIEGRMRARLREVRMTGVDDLERQIGLGRGVLWEWDQAEDGEGERLFGGWIA